MIKKTIFMIMALSMLAPLFLSAQAQDIRIKRSVIGGGGGIVGYQVDDNMTFSGIAGQIAIGEYESEAMVGGEQKDVAYYEGFWQPTFLIDPSSVDDGIPSGSSLSNFPNPFSNQTTIEYSIPGVAQVTLTIYDVNGKLIASLINGEIQNNGTYSVTWNAKNMNGVDVSSGSYLYELQVQPASFAGNSFEAFQLRNIMVVSK